jgi:hypothetical protein
VIPKLTKKEWTELKQRIKRAFEKEPEPKGLLGLRPLSPLKIVDDPVGRCFHIFDGEGKEFLCLSLMDLSKLPDELRKCFKMPSPERENYAAGCVGGFVKIGKDNPKEELFANWVVESLREWVTKDA